MNNLQFRKLSPSKYASHDGKQAVIFDDLAKKLLVLDLDAGHVEEVFDAIIHLQLFGECCGVLVFDRVLTLKPPGEVHRHKPAGNIARKPECAADGPKNLLPPPIRPGSEFFKPFADPPAMVPFLFLDLLYSFFFRRLFEALPVAAICVSGGNLARIGVLEDSNKIFAGRFQLD